MSATDSVAVDVGPSGHALEMENKESRELVAPAIPKRMSDTILEYARPMIERLPHDHTFEELRATLVFAAVVWNVVLVPDIPNAVAYLSTKMPPRLRVAPAKGLAVIRRMLTRKDRHFSSDDHFVAAIEVHRVGGKAQVTAFGVCPEPWCCGPQARA
jgi:hypothetical protein